MKRYLPAGLLVLLAAACSSSVSPGQIVTTCQVTKGVNVAIAAVTVENTSGHKFTFSGFEVLGYSNGAQVSDTSATWSKPRHVKKGKTRTWHFAIDHRSVTCDVAKLVA